MTDVSAYPGTTSLFEAAGKRGAVDPAIRAIWPGACLAGPARTVRVPRGENLSLHRMLSGLRKGDVVVVDAQGATDVAIWGEIMAVAALARGCSGLVVDGAVRDAAAMERRRFPVFARGVAIPGPGKTRAGDADIEIRVGGCNVRPGDLVVGDADGVVVVAADQARETLSRAQDREAWEARLMEDLEQGKSTTVAAFGLEPA